METYRKFFTRIFATFFTLLLFSLTQNVYAEVIGHDTIITTPTTYANTTLDLSEGNFIVREGASLTIENCDIIGTISSVTPSLIAVDWGRLNIRNSRVRVTTALVHATPKTEASYYAIRLGRALSADISNNTFTIDKKFSVGLLTSSLTLPSKEVMFANNTVENFHGGIFLLDAINSTIHNNTFKFISSGNIVFVGSDSAITNNSIYFSGMNPFGDAITILDSESVRIAKNLIFTATSESISVTLSRNIVIDSNTITGGITYAIHLFSNSELLKANNSASRLLARLGNHPRKILGSADITISNNFMGQNRYGIAAEDVTRLTVTGNYFTQRFAAADVRKFWTDNNVLLKNVSPLIWVNNIYKEAFTQVNKGDNSMTQFVIFPASGGVVL